MINSAQKGYSKKVALMAFLALSLGAATLESATAHGGGGGGHGGGGGGGGHSGAGQGFGGGGGQGFGGGRGFGVHGSVNGDYGNFGYGACTGQAYLYRHPQLPGLC